MFETPSEEIYQEMKNKAVEIWNTYDDTFWYRTEKLNIINSLDNVEDNAMVFYRMFDVVNQHKFLNWLSDESLDYINNNS